MAKLVNVWRDDDPVDLTRRQMPLIVEENLTVSTIVFCHTFKGQFMCIESYMLNRTYVMLSYDISNLT